MKKWVPLFLLIMLTMAGTAAFSQNISGDVGSPRRNTSQKKLLVKSFLGTSYADPGSSIEYKKTDYPLNPEPGVSSGLHFLFYSGKGIFLNDRLVLSYDRYKMESGNISFLMLSDYLNLGYAVNRFLSLEAGIGFNLPLYFFSTDSLFRNSAIEGSPFLYDVALSLSLGERAGIDFQYSVPFNPKKTWAYNNSLSGLIMVNDYRPVIFSLCFTYQISKKQRLLTGQSAYSIF